MIRDKTGLTGRYDFELSKVSGADESTFEDNVPVVWKLKTLGPELKEMKIETTTLVIDYIEEPSMN